MEPTEIAERIHGHDNAHGVAGDDRFRKLTGIYLGVVAMLLAITTLGGANATKQMLTANISASDTYAFYQAKYMRQTLYRTAAEQLAAEIAANPQMPTAAKASAETTIRRYRDIAARYESEPKTGNGKRELLAKAHTWEKRRERAAARNPNFELADALFQIAVVMGSVSIVAASRRLLHLSGTLSLIATLLMINGYLLLMPLPFD